MQVIFQQPKNFHWPRHYIYWSRGAPLAQLLPFSGFFFRFTVRGLYLCAPIQPPQISGRKDGVKTKQHGGHGHGPGHGADVQ